MDDIRRVLGAASKRLFLIDLLKTLTICVTIALSNSAGLFQLDQLLRGKLKGSGLEKHIEVQAPVGKKEKRLLTDFTL